MTLIGVLFIIAIAIGVVWLFRNLRGRPTRATKANTHDPAGKGSSTGGRACGKPALDCTSNYIDCTSNQPLTSVIFVQSKGNSAQATQNQPPQTHTPHHSQKAARESHRHPKPRCPTTPLTTRLAKAW